MTNSQKTIILLFLIAFSLILHMTFCEWSSPSDYGIAARPIYGSNKDDYDKILLFKTLLYADKIIYNQNVIAVVTGVFLPIALIGYAIYLYLGWKSDIDTIIKKINSKPEHQSGKSNSKENNDNNDW